MVDGLVRAKKALSEWKEKTMSCRMVTQWCLNSEVRYDGVTSAQLRFLRFFN